RALDGYEMLGDDVERLLGQPVARTLEGLLACEHFAPGHLALAAVGLVDGRVKDALRSRPDIGANAVTFDERYDGVRGHLDTGLGHRDLRSAHDKGVG